MSNFKNTPEQDAAVEAALTGGNVVITAGAGSGKTSTLRLIADALAPAKGIYIAYNKAIATDAAKSFPSNVTCRTAHSFAYRAVGHRFGPRLKQRRLTARETARILGVGPYDLKNGSELAAGRVASMVMETVNKWCHSADEIIGVKHASKVVWEAPGTEDVSYELASYLAKHAQQAWDSDLKNEVGKLRFTHDMYVKVWALSNPVLPADFILYDEAQDADPCIAGIVLAQTGKQLIAVGDESQAIYGWRGATDAMKAWPAQHRVSLTKSFRFGPAVAAEANVFLNLLDAPLRIVGHDPIDSKVGPLTEADAILCRTNAAVIAEALAATAHGRTFAIVGGTDQIKRFAEAAEKLMEGERVSWHADLGAFKSWDDVLDYVENDSGGSDLRSLVKLITNFGLQAIYNVCENARPEGAADVTLSTAHKSKGREWNRVRIAADFQPSEDREGEGLSRPEAMLMYVAVTRAKLALDCEALAWAKDAPAAPVAQVAA
jgi:superfamily I DNA/RNA helicase